MFCILRRPTCIVEETELPTEVSGKQGGKLSSSSNEAFVSIDFWMFYANTLTNYILELNKTNLHSKSDLTDCVCGVCVWTALTLDISMVTLKSI